MQNNTQAGYGSKSHSNISNINYDSLVALQKSGKPISYKRLCEQLDLPTLTGNSKIKQMRELSSVCEYTKKNGRIIINKICSRKELALFNSRSIYAPYIELILLETFKTHPDDIIFLTNAQILGLCNIINNNYQCLLGDNMYQKSKHIANKYSFKHEDFFTYLDKTYYRVLLPIVKSALKSMDRRMSIGLNKGYKAYKYNKEDQSYITTCISETDELGQELFKIEGDALTKLGISTKSELYGKNKQKITEYYDYCNTLIKQKSNTDPIWRANNWDYTGFYQCYALVLNHDRIGITAGTLKEELNLRIQNKILTTSVLDMLTGEDRKLFISATIDKQGELDYNFYDDLNII